MQLHEFSKSVGKRKRPQRVGRGGKRGTTSGRGQKGQKSRSGHSIRPAERDLILRLPKLRGFANKAASASDAVLSLGQIAKKFKKFSTGKTAVLINLAALREAGLVDKTFWGKVKILGGGKLEFPVTIKGLKISASAKIAIEKAGGKVE
ncbi:MAG: 50S ribosomal protein L15 [Candidatus Liptonbacteria bacterium]|nr:50S ribosomal protein L15 [Candidatus Liptonbacteria bacterium]